MTLLSDPTRLGPSYQVIYQVTFHTKSVTTRAEGRIIAGASGRTIARAHFFAMPTRPRFFCRKAIFVEKTSPKNRCRQLVLSWRLLKNFDENSQKIRTTDTSVLNCRKFVNYLL